MIEPLCPVCRRYAKSVRQTIDGTERTRVWDHGYYTCRAVDQVVPDEQVDKAAAAAALDPRIGRGS